MRGPSGSCAPLPFLALLSLLTLLGGCDDGVTRVPPELIGTWTTDAPAYRNRYLEISPVRLVFGTGRGSSQRHRLAGARREPSEAGTTEVGYALIYATPGGRSAELPLLFTPESGSIRLAYREEIWSRTPAAGE